MSHSMFRSIFSFQWRMVFHNLYFLSNIFYQYKSIEMVYFRQKHVFSSSEITVSFFLLFIESNVSTPYLWFHSIFSHRNKIFTCIIFNSFRYQWNCKLIWNKFCIETHGWLLWFNGMETETRERKSRWRIQLMLITWHMVLKQLLCALDAFRILYISVLFESYKNQIIIIIVFEIDT